MQLFGIDFSCPIVQAIIAIVITGGIALITFIRFYALVTCGKCNSNAKMNGKTVIITGANSGIGKCTARDLAKRGARVIMACRNMELSQKVRDEIIKSTGNQNVILKKIDLSSQKSIRDFADDILKTEQRVDVLIHNAGMSLAFRREKSVDGIELTMASNHYGPYLLTHLLIDLLKKSAPCRIVVVASSLYRLANVNLNNLNPVNTFPPVYLYYASKLANIYFTRELARRLEGTNVTANCLHPGLVDTGIWRNVPFPVNYPFKLLTKGFFKTEEQGAATSIYCAVSEDLNGVSGRYYSDCKEATLSNLAQDMERAKILWEGSYKIVNLTDKDPKI